MSVLRRILRSLTGGNALVDCPICAHHRDFMFTLTLCELCKSRGVLKRWKLTRYLRNIERRVRHG